MGASRGRDLPIYLSPPSLSVSLSVSLSLSLYLSICLFLSLALSFSLSLSLARSLSFAWNNFQPYKWHIKVLSLLSSLPTYLPTSLPPYLPPSLPTSLIPTLPPSRPPSLPPPLSFLCLRALCLPLASPDLIQGKGDPAAAWLRLGVRVSPEPRTQQHTP